MLVFAIFRKELQGYFASPLAYIVAGIFWLLSGFIFVVLLLGPGGIIQRVAFQEQQSAFPISTDVAYIFLGQFLSTIGSISPLILPMLSMGLYAEERKGRTLELLATSPISNWAVALGKLLGVVTFYITLLVPLIICETIAFSAADPPFPPAVPLLAHLGLILLAASILSLGMFISSLTSSSLISAFVTFALVIFLALLDVIGARAPQPLGDILNHISLLKHYETFLQGIFDWGSLALFASYIILGIFLTAQSIETLRFQRS
ncbi:MAG: ABC transporter permease subunit [Cyanobacteria bacterium SBLK]|nr:ABC transporter permease subunit [Cyanobacteria bacterium SBLK]